jgi:phosphate transport system protein
MAEIVLPTKPLSVNPLKATQPIGASLAFLGLADAIPLEHGARGCTSFNKLFFNSQQAKQAVDGDAAIDAMQREIEDYAVQVIARRQPVAIDLRTIIGAMRIAGDLERMGDMALWQVETVLDSYSKRDAEMALKAWTRDHEIDQQYNALFRDLLTYMMEDPKTISYAAHLLFCAKNIERVGDHCTNIAESVSYVVTGQTISDGRPRHGVSAGNK